MDCRKVSEIAFLYIDNEMESDLAKPFQDHLSHCPCCASQVDHRRKLVILVRQRCVRQQAPQRLRVRILTSLPHRQGWA